jgi:hypothetical protein
MCLNNIATVVEFRRKKKSIKENKLYITFIIYVVEHFPDMVCGIGRFGNVDNRLCYRVNRAHVKYRGYCWCHA